VQSRRLNLEQRQGSQPGEDQNIGLTWTTVEQVYAAPGLQPGEDHNGRVVLDAKKLTAQRWVPVSARITSSCRES